MKVIFIWGPQAVGKLAVGHEIAKHMHFRVIFAHITMKKLEKFFKWGSGPFIKLDLQLHVQIFNEYLNSNSPGVILTKVRFLNRKKDLQLVETILVKARARKIPIYEVELYADLDTRIERACKALQLENRASKRNLKKCESRLRKSHASDIQVTSTHSFGMVRENYLKLDITNQTAEETARQIMQAFNLSNSQ